MSQCEVCSSTPAKLCGGCAQAYYCGPGCQKTDWKVHKNQCFPVRVQLVGHRGVVAMKNIQQGQIVIRDCAMVRAQHSTGTHADQDIVSCINHSCSPNAMWSEVKGKMREMRALTTIDKGDAITCSYYCDAKNMAFASRNDRRQVLRNWNFECRCVLCDLDGEELEENEVKRRELRKISKEIEYEVDKVEKARMCLQKMEMIKMMGVEMLSELSSTYQQAFLAGWATEEEDWRKKAELVRLDWEKWVKTFPLHSVSLQYSIAIGGVSEMFKISEVAGKGLGWIAKRDIKKGEKVWEEDPIIDNMAWSAGGLGLLELDQQVNRLNASDKEQFLSLNDPDKNGEPVFKNGRIFQNNVMADGVFIVLSRLNHSCHPNVIWSTDDSQAPYHYEVRALKDIPSGEEMTGSYLRGSLLRIRAERKELLNKWRFICLCPLCSLAGEELQKNEKSRQVVLESKVKIAHFIDTMLSMGARRRNIQVKAMFMLASNNLKLVETNLEIEAAGPNTMNALHDLSVLSAVAHKLRLCVPDCARPQAYQERAKEVASNLGKMFLTSCEANQEELEGIKTMRF